MESRQISHVSDIIGQWGSFQRNIFLFYFTIYILSPFNNLGITFHAPKVNFWCKSKENNLTFLNNTDNCLNCTEWKYDNSEFHSNIIEEWDLVCSRSWLPSFSQSCYQFGYIINGLLLGYLSDRYGRRPILWLAITIEILSGVSVIFSQSIYQYIISRFFLGLGDSGRGVCLYLILIETIDQKYRSDMTMSVSFGWVIGYLILPLSAYFIKSFRFLQLFPTGLALLMFVSWLWSIPESPRWQLTHNKKDQARNNIIKAAKANGKDINQISDKLFQLEKHFQLQKSTNSSQHNYTLFDLLSTSKIRKYTLIFWFLFAVNAFIYHGISLNVADFGGNVYINFAFAGLVEIPSIILNIFGLRSFGRRIFVSSTLLISALANLLIVSLSIENVYIKVTLTMVGKLFIFSCFNAIYIYAGEAFPTVLRHTAVGSCSIAARIGSIFAPFVKEICQHFHIGIALILFAVLALSSSFFTMLLPETKDKDIPDSIQEMEDLANK